MMIDTNLPDEIDGELDDGFGVADHSTDGQTVALSHVVTADESGLRLDKLATTVFAEFSRVQVQSFIENGELLVNQAPQKPKYRVKADDVLTLQAVLEDHSADLPENIALDVVYEDDDVIVINKPAGLVVHPGAGNRTGTLVNALLYHYPDNAHLPRAGLVHRIDKDTTGLLVVARSKSAQLDLTEQLKDKSVYRHYQCVCQGVPSDILRHATIDLPIARHQTQRTKMAVRDSGKPAVTHILKAQGLGERYSLLDVRLETGRTHQIRVHLSHLGFALVGDAVYGKPIKSGLSEACRQAVQGFSRQALHAYRLGFIHPKSGEKMEFCADLPDDMKDLIDVLKQD
ncbi:RluA family pseudouridine synthase [Moraxella nasibovis]|uniref:RluA family pseudouridine synthase n=1 Tax=Moraxella nasibovis TaxID=2904120 RepID=UPI00240FD008|nr:RluA family pseudouridine synthase [Moraxella nasibovis]WFF37839.1 RluA family pseudouridine synthase [Moraxella nasibovis]